MSGRRTGRSKPAVNYAEPRIEESEDGIEDDRSEGDPARGERVISDSDDEGLATRAVQAGSLMRFAKPGVDNTQTTTKLGPGRVFGKRKKTSSDGTGSSKLKKLKRSGGVSSGDESDFMSADEASEDDADEDDGEDADNDAAQAAAGTRPATNGTAAGAGVIQDSDGDRDGDDGAAVIEDSDEAPSAEVGGAGPAAGGPVAAADFQKFALGSGTTNGGVTNGGVSRGGANVRRMLGAPKVEGAANGAGPMRRAAAVANDSRRSGRLATQPRRDYVNKVKDGDFEAQESPSGEDAYNVASSEEAAPPAVSRSGRTLKKTPAFQQAEIRKKPKKAAKVIDSEDDESEGDLDRDDEDGSLSEEEDAGDTKKAQAALNSLGQPEKILSNKRENGQGLFLVKFKGKSYRKCEWLTEAVLREQRPHLITAYIRKTGNMGMASSNHGIQPEWTTVERVFAARPHPYRSGRKQYLVKWGVLGYNDSTWEDPEDLEQEKDFIAAFHRMNTRPPAVKETDPKALLNMLAAGKGLPEFKNGRTLRSYQADSFKWMVHHNVKGQNCVLGDEMGLGKTAQSISVMEFRRTKANVKGPFLVVAPLTTLGHWRREIETWTDMNVVCYMGGKDDRAVIDNHELYFREDPSPSGAPGRKTKLRRFEVLLTSFEILRDSQNVFDRFLWDVVIVDEAHRLKNLNSGTRLSIADLDTKWLLLLTGTPIQNNMTELFSIMNLVAPEQFDDAQAFLYRFGNPPTTPSTPDQMLDLQNELRPLLLRRMKEDVETLPDKEEVIIWVELTNEQRYYYKALYENQIAALLGGGKGANLPQMRNLAMELRKLCCHPFLCNGLEEDLRSRIKAQNKGTGPTDQELMEAGSGKIMLMSKLLPKLRREGHKLLIFSQFKIMLDLVEDYLNLLAMPFERIDGDTKGSERQAAMDRFQAGGDNTFAFLLSTKAGGQGITLTAADTIIIYDSDWNPQNDVQAMARAHRIGQVNEVTIYRLVTKNTYEEQLLNTANRKYGLNEAILGNINTVAGNPEDNAKRIAQLLKDGAFSIIADEAAGTSAGDTFANEDIDAILASRTTKRSMANKAGNTFSVASFKSTSTTAPKGDDKEFWTSLLPEAAQAHKAAQQRVNLVDGPRRRHRVCYKEIKTPTKRGGRKRSTSPAGDDYTALMSEDDSGNEMDGLEGLEKDEKEAKGKRILPGGSPIKPGEITLLDNLISGWGTTRVLKILEDIPAMDAATAAALEKQGAEGPPKLPDHDTHLEKAARQLMTKRKSTAADLRILAHSWATVIQASISHPPHPAEHHLPEDAHMRLRAAELAVQTATAEGTAVDAAAAQELKDAQEEVATVKVALNTVNVAAMNAWMSGLLQGHANLEAAWASMKQTTETLRLHPLLRAIKGNAQRAKLWREHDALTASFEGNVEGSPLIRGMVKLDRTSHCCSNMHDDGWFGEVAKYDVALMHCVRKFGLDDVTAPRCKETQANLVGAFTILISHPDVPHIAGQLGQQAGVKYAKFQRNTVPNTNTAYFKHPSGHWYVGPKLYSEIGSQLIRRAHAIMGAIAAPPPPPRPQLDFMVDAQLADRVAHANGAGPSGRPTSAQHPNVQAPPSKLETLGGAPSRVDGRGFTHPPGTSAVSATPGAAAGAVTAKSLLSDKAAAHSKARAKQADLAALWKKKDAPAGGASPAAPAAARPAVALTGGSGPCAPTAQPAAAAAASPAAASVTAAPSGTGSSASIAGAAQPAAPSAAGSTAVPPALPPGPAGAPLGDAQQRTPSKAAAAPGAEASAKAQAPVISLVSPEPHRAKPQAGAPPAAVKPAEGKPSARAPSSGGSSAMENDPSVAEEGAADMQLCAAEPGPVCENIGDETGVAGPSGSAFDGGSWAPDLVSTTPAAACGLHADCTLPAPCIVPGAALSDLNDCALLDALHHSLLDPACPICDTGHAPPLSDNWDTADAGLAEAQRRGGTLIWADDLFGPDESNCDAAVCVPAQLSGADATLNLTASSARRSLRSSAALVDAFAGPDLALHGIDAAGGCAGVDHLVIQPCSGGDAPLGEWGPPVSAVRTRRRTSAARGAAVRDRTAAAAPSQQRTAFTADELELHDGGSVHDSIHADPSLAVPQTTPTLEDISSRPSDPFGLGPRPTPPRSLLRDQEDAELDNPVRAPAATARPSTRPVTRSSRSWHPDIVATTQDIVATTRAPPLRTLRSQNPSRALAEASQNAGTSAVNTAAASAAANNAANRAGTLGDSSAGDARAVAASRVLASSQNMGTRAVSTRAHASRATALQFSARGGAAAALNRPVVPSAPTVLAADRALGQASGSQHAATPSGVTSGYPSAASRLRLGLDHTPAERALAERPEYVTGAADGRDDGSLSALWTAGSWSGEQSAGAAGYVRPEAALCAADAAGEQTSAERAAGGSRKRPRSRVSSLEGRAVAAVPASSVQTPPPPNGGAAPAEGAGSGGVPYALRPRHARLNTAALAVADAAVPAEAPSPPAAAPRGVPRLALPRLAVAPPSTSGERPLSARLRSAAAQQRQSATGSSMPRTHGSPQPPPSAAHASLLSDATPYDPAMHLFQADLQRRIAGSASEAGRSLSTSPAASTGRKPVRSLSVALEALATEQAVASRLRYGLSAGARKAARQSPQ